MAIAFLTLFGGCASHVPLEIRRDITDRHVSIEEAAMNFEQYQGAQVRWGGTIANVENKADDTWIEIVGRELGSYGQPLISDYTPGRFIARVNGFLDPAIYAVDREITVYGQLESRVVRQIDDHPYTYPLVSAQSHYLWDAYYDRYYYPYAYRYYRYPYYYPYHYSFYYSHGFGHHHHRHHGHHGHHYRFGLHHY